MNFIEKVKEDEKYRYDWLQVNSVIPKQPGDAQLGDSYFAQKQVSLYILFTVNKKVTNISCIIRAVCRHVIRIVQHFSTHSHWLGTSSF